MKRLSRGLIVAGLVTISAAAWLGSASAGAVSDINICHIQGGAEVHITVSQSGALNGHTHHVHDVIPPFGTFPGQNWPPTVVNEFCQPVNPYATTTTTPKSVTTTTSPYDTTTSSSTTFVPPPPPPSTTSTSTPSSTSTTSVPEGTTTTTAPASVLDVTTTVVSTTSTTPTSVEDTSSPLASTGTFATPLAAVGAAMLLVGLVVSLRRRPNKS